MIDRAFLEAKLQELTAELEQRKADAHAMQGAVQFCRQLLASVDEVPNANT